MDKKIIEKIHIGIIILTILLILSLITITPLLNSIILSIICGYIVHLISKRINKHIKSPSLSVILGMLIIIIPIILLSIYSTGALISSLSTIIPPDLDVQINQTFTASISNPQSPLHLFFGSLDQIITQLKTLLTNSISNIISDIAILYLEIFIFITGTFYFARDGTKIIQYLKDIAPDDKKRYVTGLVSEIKNVTNSIFFGHFLTAIFIGIIATIGFTLLGYPYALFLGILTGICQLIPIIGPWPVYTILCIYDIITGNYIRAIIVLIFGFGLSLSDIYLKPALSGKYAKIHPFVFLIGFFTGPLLMGLTGFITGPLILGITYTLLLNYRKYNSIIKTGQK